MTVKRLYPSVGLEWYNKWDNNKSRNLGDGKVDPYDSRFTYSNGQPDIPLQIKGDKTARFRTSKVCTSARLWVNGPWKNTEITVYLKPLGINPDIQLRSRANHEIGDNCQCVFGNYIVAWSNKDKKVIAYVEVMHPIYKRYVIVKPFEGFQKDVYYGYKQITRTVEGNKVRVEGWFNKNIDDQTDWIKQIEFTFDGTNVRVTPTAEEEICRQSCINKGDKVANNLTTLWLNEGKRCWLRLNNCTDFNLRYFSIREIDAI